MESDSKKCKLSEENDCRDRLSELPDEILVQILSFLPTLDAVRTVLLRRFGNLWTMIPSLDFDDQEILYSKQLLSENVDKDEIGRSDMNNCFTSYVRNVLLFHNSYTIDKFVLRIAELDWLGNNSRRNRAVLDEIKMWIKYAIQKEVKELNLRFICCFVDDYVLPRYVFSSQFLVKLRISGVRIEHLSQVHMGALESLSLSHVEVSNELFKKLISGCPSLRVLDIEDQVGLDELCFTAPNVEELVLDVNPCLLDCPNIKILNIFLHDRESAPEVVDVSSLREVNVYSLHSGDQINELVKMFYKAEVFKLFLSVVRPFQLKEPDLPETRWNHLQICSQLHNVEELLSICRFLRFSPHLEELELYTGPWSHKDCCKLSLELPPSFVMPQLKNVTLRGYMVSCQGLLRVVEFLLKSAVALDKLVIVCKKNVLAAVDEVEFVKNLSGFSRASTTAKVVLGFKIY